MAYDRNCAGYMDFIVDYDDTLIQNETFILNAPPKPISCNNQTLNGWGPPQHQAWSCCDEGARFVTQNGLMGGFGNIPNFLPGNGELVPGTGGDEQYHTQCAPYIDNLKATLCDPQQGRYIREDPRNNRTVFRICKTSCDLVYDQCEYLLPEANLASTITDGTAFCLASWGTTFFHNDSCGELKELVFPCEQICKSWWWKMIVCPSSCHRQTTWQAIDFSGIL